MRFSPEKLKIPDQRMKPFIDPDEIWDLINNTKPDKQRVREVIAKSLEQKPSYSSGDCCPGKFDGNRSC